MSQPNKLVSRSTKALAIALHCELHPARYLAFDTNVDGNVTAWDESRMMLVEFLPCPQLTPEVIQQAVYLAQQRESELTDKDAGETLVVLWVTSKPDKSLLALVDGLDESVDVECRWPRYTYSILSMTLPKDAQPHTVDFDDICKQIAQESEWDTNDVYGAWDMEVGNGELCAVAVGGKVFLR